MTACPGTGRGDGRRLRAGVGAASHAAEVLSCQRATLQGATSSVPALAKGRDCEPHSKSR